MTYITLYNHDMNFRHSKDGRTSIDVHSIRSAANQSFYLDEGQSDRIREELNKFQPETVEVPEGWTKQDVLDAIEAYSPTPEWAGADFLRARAKYTGDEVRFVRVLGEGADSMYTGPAGTRRTVGDIADLYTDITAVG